MKCAKGCAKVWSSCAFETSEAITAHRSASILDRCVFRYMGDFSQALEVNKCKGKVKRDYPLSGRFQLNQPSILRVFAGGRKP
jgi:hypothetical protein